MMKKSLAGTALAVISLLTVMVTGCSYQDFADARFQRQMVQASSENNKKLPKMIDEETRLDTTVAGPGKQWTYRYTLVNYKAGDTDNERINAVLGDNIRKGFCNTKEMQLFIENGVTMRYKYSGKDGAYLGEVVVTPMDCKKFHGSARKPD